MEVPIVAVIQPCCFSVLQLVVLVLMYPGFIGLGSSPKFICKTDFVIDQPGLLITIENFRNQFVKNESSRLISFIMFPKFVENSASVAFTLVCVYSKMMSFLPLL